MDDVYSIIDSNGICISNILWDRTTEWKPPDGYIAIPGIYPINEQTNIIISSSLKIELDSQISGEGEILT